MSAVEDLAVELDHTEHQGENEERSLVCRHPSHYGHLGTVYAPCSSSRIAARLFAAIAQDKAARA